MTPAQQLFITHLKSGDYEVGAAKGMWGKLLYMALRVPMGRRGLEDRLSRPIHLSI
jgi:hypothetical protein